MTSGRACWVTAIAVLEARVQRGPTEPAQILAIAHVSPKLSLHIGKIVARRHHCASPGVEVPEPFVRHFGVTQVFEDQS